MASGPNAPVLAALLARRPMAPLGPGVIESAMEERLEALTHEDICGREPVSPIQAEACRAGLWLAFGQLERAHAVAQGVATAEGSFWHAIMHRREPDYANSKYWFGKVGRHAIDADLAAAGKILAAGVPAAPDWMRTGATWDAARFVDFVEAAAGGDEAAKPLAVGLQDAEWQLLFAYCWRLAVGVE